MFPKELRVWDLQFEVQVFFGICHLRVAISPGWHYFFRYLWYETVCITTKFYGAVL
jgi:hypothetical protein